MYKDDLNVDLKGLWVEANIVAEAAYNRRIDDTQGPPLAAIALPSSAEGVEMTTKGPHRRKKKATTSAQRTKVAARQFVNAFSLVVHGIAWIRHVPYKLCTSLFFCVISLCFS